MRAVRPLTACLLVLLSARTLGQQPAPAPQTPVFRGGVDLVTIDVRVVDNDGRPIAGLTPDDFAVTLDGKAHPVRALDYMTFGSAMPGIPDAPATPPTAPATVTATAAPAKSRGGRIVLLMVDDAAMRPLEGKGLTTSAERMLATFDPGDLVGITTTSGLGPAIAPTRDRAAILSALGSRDVIGRADIRQTRPLVTVDEAVDITRGMDLNALSRVAARECGLPQTGARSGGEEVNQCTSSIRQMARQIDDTAERTTGQQLAAVTHAIDLLQTVPAPRVLVLLTTGIALSPYRPSPLDDLSRVASQADVGFYALVATDMTGVDLSDKGDSVPPGVESRAEARRREGAFLTDGTQSAALAAGGDAFRVIGTADRFLDRIVSETSALYRLGVEEPIGADPGHAMVVSVKVKRPGAVVRANTHALPPVPAKPLSTPEAMKLRLEQGGATFGVPLTLATTVRRDTGTRMQLLMNLDVPAATPGPLTAMVAVVNAAGAIVQSGQKTLPAVPSDDYRLAVPFAVDEGDYHLRVVLADANGNIGSVDEPVIARPRVVGPFTSSDLFLSAVGADRVQHLLARDTIPPGAVTVHTELDVYVPIDVKDIEVRLTVTSADGGDPVAEDVLTPVAHDGRLTVTAEIPAATLEPGRYIVTATVLHTGDPVGRVSAKLQKVIR